MLNFVNPVAEWLYSTVANTVDPALTQEENDLLKNVTEYLQAKNGKKTSSKKRNKEETEVIEEKS